jgi:putative membrane protein
MKTHKILIAAFAVLTIISSVTFAQTDKKAAEKQNDKKFEKSDMETDADFAMKAADMGMFEVQVAELAKTNASSEKVKELAKMMIADHSKVNEELKMLASKKNITLPTKLSDKLQKEFDELTKLKGADFDKEYTKEMVGGHKDAIDMFQKEADKGSDGEFKAWCAGKIAALKHHLEMSEATHDLVK